MSWGLIEGELPVTASLWVPPGLEKDAGLGSAPLGAQPDHKETGGITGPRRKETGPCGVGGVMEGGGAQAFGTVKERGSRHWKRLWDL